MEPSPEGPHPDPVTIDARAARAVTDADLPFALRVSAAWAWRVAVILVVAWAIAWALAQMSFLVIPVLIAALLAGLLNPVVGWLRRARAPKGVAVAVTELG